VRAPSSLLYASDAASALANDVVLGSTDYLFGTDILHVGDDLIANELSDVSTIDASL
jgi:hypothetical protein